MKDILIFLNKTAVKIGIIVSLLFLSLFVILNYLVLSDSESAFVRVLEGERYGTILLEDPNMKPRRYNVLEYKADGTQRARPLEEEFTNNFQTSLLKVGALGVISSFFIGLLVTTVLMRPLRKLSKGMKKLRENDYKVNLEKTDTYEIDELIDEFNNLTKELEKVENLRKDLISDTSHELKTPLAGLKAQLEGVKDGVFKLDKSRISTLIHQVNRLSDVVERLQEFTRLRNRSVKPSCCSVDLKSVISQIEKQLATELNNKDIDITVKIQNGLNLNADPNMIEQIFYNLIQNSIKYSECSKITINADSEKIVYKDNGKGVSKEHINYIFERFYRVEKSRSRSTGGLGLGLPIVKEIVDGHGWSISVENNNGLQFTIKLN